MYLVDDESTKNLTTQARILEKSLNDISLDLEGVDELIIILNIRPEVYFEKYPKQHGNLLQVSRKRRSATFQIGIAKDKINEHTISAYQLSKIVKNEIASSEDLKATEFRQNICKKVYSVLETSMF